VFVGVPARGQLVAADGERATVDDELGRGFVFVVEREYLQATERDRISREIIIYYDDKPIGRVRANLTAARQLMRTEGVDPDA
jgi:hypothetical protein